MDTAQAYLEYADDIYEPVRRHAAARRERRVDKKAVIVIAALLVFFVGMILSFWWLMSYWNRYSDMCAKLSAATAYAYDNGCATVTDGSTAYALAQDNIYEIYQCVCVYGPGREKFGAPAGESVTVDFGEGSSMRLVQTGTGEEARLYFCFSSADGFAHTFYTSDINLEYMMKRYLSQKRQL